MKKKIWCLLMIAVLSTAGFQGCGGQNEEAEPQESTDVADNSTEPDEDTAEVDALAFPIDDFAEETVSVETADGEKSVTYRLYQHICYVENPVDSDYQSMDVKVPIVIDAQGIDASNAPILFSNGVGGYMSSSNSDNPDQQNTFTEDIIANENTSGDTADSSGETVEGASQNTGIVPGAGADGSNDATQEISEDSSAIDSEGASQNTGIAPDAATELPEGGLSDLSQNTGDMVSGEDPMKKTNGSVQNENINLALAAGYVVVEPGCRGRDNSTDDGVYYGKAPAVIVDLKAAVRYLKYNDSVMPGDAERIISTGVSAGGAVSSLLGASGDSDLYESYLDELGAAEASDKVYAAAAFCPITDLEHADMAYEWMFGSQKYNGSSVDSNTSNELAQNFITYQESLGYEGLDDFGTITADNYEEYLLEYYLEPSATTYLENLSEADRETYLKENTFISWKDGKAEFSFDDYLDHIGRSKDAPAFDDFALTSAETQLFGDAKTNARHFTEYGVANNTAEDGNTTLDSELQTVINMMNPMYFIGEDYEGCADYWWIRYGTSDTNTSLPVIINLATGLENNEKDVNTLLYWDAGHGADEDPDDFIAWIADITGFEGYASIA